MVLISTARSEKRKKKHSQWLGVVEKIVGRPRPRQYPGDEGLGGRRVRAHRRVAHRRVTAVTVIVIVVVVIVVVVVTAIVVAFRAAVASGGCTCCCPGPARPAIRRTARRAARLV